MSAHQTVFVVDDDRCWQVLASRLLTSAGFHAQAYGSAERFLADTGVLESGHAASLSSPSSQAVTVDYTTSDITATAGEDYVTTSACLVFNPGETVRTITIPIVNDTVDEPDEQFRVTLSSAVGATIATTEATATILDDDEPPLPSLAFGSTAIAIAENAGSAAFVVTLSSASSQTVTVAYATSDLSATAGVDYTAVSGTLTFDPGETSKTITVTILDDTEDEPDEQFRVTLSSASGATIATTEATATILNVTMNPINNPPAAEADVYQVLHDSVLSASAALGVLANDTDPEGDAIAATLVSAAESGIVTLNPDGSFVYIPTAGFVGHDFFRYRATDGQASSDVVMVMIAVLNHVPIPLRDDYRTPPGTPLVVDAAEGILANDLELDGEPLALTVIAGPHHGTLDIAADGSFTYLPQPGYVGTDEFRYTVSDGLATSPEVAVTIEVFNAPPTGRDDWYRLWHDTSLSVGAVEGVLANDGADAGETLSAALVEGITHGFLAFGADGSFTYVPDAGFVGTDRFVYAVRDGLTADNNVVVYLDVQNSPVGAQADVSWGASSRERTSVRSRHNETSVRWSWLRDRSIRWSSGAI